MELFVTTANGKKVYFDPVGSRAATHLADHPNLAGILKSFLARQSFTGPVVWVEHDTGSIVGDTDMVETAEDDEIVYAKRLNRHNYTRFVKNRRATPTSYITVALKENESGDYELASAWIGRLCPNFPDEPNATRDSRPFWGKHALAWGTQAVQLGTETTVCPW